MNLLVLRPAAILAGGKRISPDGGEMTLKVTSETDVHSATSCSNASDITEDSVIEGSEYVRPQPVACSATQTSSTHPQSAIQRPDIQWFCLLFVIAIAGSTLVKQWLEPEHPPLPPELHGNTGFSLDLNEASVAELSLLPNVGPTLAQRIVEERTAHGPFQDVSDIKRTRGIGDDRFKQMEKMLRVTR